MYMDMTEFIDGHHDEVDEYGRVRGKPKERKSYSFRQNSVYKTRRNYRRTMARQKHQPREQIRRIRRPLAHAYLQLRRGAPIRRLVVRRTVAVGPGGTGAVTVGGGRQVLELAQVGAVRVKPGSGGREDESEAHWGLLRADAGTLGGEYVEDEDAEVIFELRERDGMETRRVRRSHCGGVGASQWTTRRC